MSELKELQLPKQEAIKLAAVNLNFFAGLLIPHICTVPFPSYYQFLWEMFTQVGMEDFVLRFVLGLPRGHAKTTFVKLLICYCILYDKFFFILIVCANENLASNALEDIATMLSSGQVVDLYGGWKAALVRDTVALKRGPHHGHDKILAALGAGSSLRGINIANRRPDFIFCDDMQTRESALSPTEASALYTWYLGTLLKARNKPRCLIIYVGNMYNKDCILYKLKLHPKWKTFITSAILQDLTPLWAEYFSLAELMEEYEHDKLAGHPEIWFAEVMNIPIGGENSLIQGSSLPIVEVSPYELPIASFITIDPAGYRDNSDDNVIAGHSIYADMNYQVEDILAGRMKPDEVVILTFDMASRLGAKFIFIETVAYQQILKWYFEREAANYPSLDVQFRELKPGRRQKTSRILSFFKSVYANGYYIAAKVRGLVFRQAIAFKLDRTDNKDDILDCVSYGLDVKSQYQAELLSYQSYCDSMAVTEEYKVAQKLGVKTDNTFLDR